MNGSARPIQNILAVGVGGSAFVGFIILNLAAADIVGLPLAIASGTVSGILNSIFHSLPVQRADMPKSAKEGALLFLALVISTAGTGYVYATSEASVKKVITDNPFCTIPIALSYQGSYALPIAFLLNAVLQNLLGWNKPAPAKLIATDEMTSGPMGIQLLNNTDEELPTAIAVAGSITTDKGEDTLLLASTKTNPVPARAKCGKVALKVLSYGIASGLWVSFAAAAFVLFQPKAATADAVPLSAISKFYQPIYGTNLYLTIALHIPIWLLAAWGSEEGFYAGFHSIADLIKNCSGKKGGAALLILGILALTSITTYAISNFGDVSTALLAIAVAATILSNYAPAAISAAAMVELVSGDLGKAIGRFTDKEPVTTFFKAQQAPPPATTIVTATRGA